MRINARLDDSYTQKIDYLRQATGLSLSDVVRESVERYYRQIRAEAERQRDELDDLVGAFEGQDDSPTNLAAEYKRWLWTERPSNASETKQDP
jgi:Arc/MetJ-type ribon-helix-helix transcriptional regulator